MEIKKGSVERKVVKVVKEDTAVITLTRSEARALRQVLVCVMAGIQMPLTQHLTRSFIRTLSDKLYNSGFSGAYLVDEVTAVEVDELE